MQYNISRTSNYALGTIVTSGYDVTVALITIDTHHENTTHDQAVHQLYDDALMSGAGKYSREALLEAFSLLGASFSAGVAEGRITYSIRSSAAVFPKVIKLVETVLTEPTFSERELDRIKSVVKNELHTKRELSAVIAREALCNNLYDKKDRRHNVSIDTLITAIDTITTSDLREYHQSVFGINWTCTITGEQAEIDTFSKLVAKLKKATETTTISAAHAQKAAHAGLSLHDVPSRSNIDFSIGIPVPITIHHQDYAPMVFGLGVLGIPGGFAGRLMSTVREKEGFTYGIYAHVESFSGNELGFVRIGTFFTPEKTIPALTTTFREISKFYKSGISQMEFDKFQTIFKTKQALLQDSPLKQLTDLHSFNANGFTVEEITAFKDKINTITRAEVNSVIKKYFDPKLFFISGAGPVAGVKKDIEAFVANMS